MEKKLITELSHHYYQPYALECCPVEPLAQLEWKAHGTTGFVDIKLEYTLHKAAGDSPGRYRITERQITIAKDWKSDPGRTPWSAESRKRLTVDDGRRLSHDLQSVTMTSGKRPAQHWPKVPQIRSTVHNLYNHALNRDLPSLVYTRKALVLLLWQCWTLGLSSFCHIAAPCDILIENWKESFLEDLFGGKRCIYCVSYHCVVWARRCCVACAISNQRAETQRMVNLCTSTCTSDSSLFKFDAQRWLQYPRPKFAHRACALSASESLCSWFAGWY